MGKRSFLTFEERLFDKIKIEKDRLKDLLTTVKYYNLYAYGIDEGKYLCLCWIEEQMMVQPEDEDAPTLRHE